MSIAVLASLGADVVMVDGQNIPCPEASLIGEPLEWSNLKGCWAGGFTCGYPSPLTFTQQSVTAWAMAHQPSWIVIGSVVR